jgi:hypothetical protein
MVALYVERNLKTLAFLEIPALCKARSIATLAEALIKENIPKLGGFLTP